jgi:peptide/nickel transport system ATP-binding protein
MKAVGLTVEADGRRLLEAVDLEVRPGELVALTGPSGSGKTVLVRTLLGVFDGRPGRVAGTVDVGAVAWLPQDGRRALDPLARIGTGSEALRQRLSDLRLGDATDRFPHQLSGGMAKRAALARALALSRPFLIVDEPATGVDAALGRALVQALREAADAGTGVLWVTHDTAAAAAIADRCIAIDEGRIVPFDPDVPGIPRPDRAPSDAVVLALRDVSFAYRSWSGATPVLSDFSLTVRAGERVALVGPSGSGKSTVALLAVGLRRPDRGTVRLMGRNPVPGRDSQLLPQDARALTVEGLPLRTALLRSARLHGRTEAHADAALTACGLAHRAHATPDTLSGGELRRAAIARIRLARPRLLVADEPVAGLDAPLRPDIARVLFDAVQPSSEAPGAVLFITHDASFASAAAHRVVEMPAGRA